jgi:hypothetical protein
VDLPAAGLPVGKLVFHLFIYLFTYFGLFSTFWEEQKHNGENCRISSARTGDILDPPKFVDTECWSVACLSHPGAELTLLSETATSPGEHDIPSALEQTT